MFLPRILLLVVDLAVIWLLGCIKKGHNNINTQIQFD